MGMHAENEQRKLRGESMAYVEEHFVALLDEHAIGWNDAISLLNEGEEK